MPERISSLRLRGDKVQVRYVHPDELGDESEHCDGLFTSHDGLIEVRHDALGAGGLRTLCHEITHYFLVWGALSDVFLSHDDTGKLEEGVCNAIGSMLYEVIRDNPDLVCEIIGVDSKQTGEQIREIVGRMGGVGE